MEKGDLTTGQLLSIKEKNGKLVREYVAGFFGEEPIIKQRLLTPQEARRYREDMSRARSEGKTVSEAARSAGSTSAPGAPKKRLVRRRRVAPPGPTEQAGNETPVPQAHTADHAVSANTAPIANAPSTTSGDSPAPPAEAPVKSIVYLDQGEDARQFVTNLVNSEPEKPNYKPAKMQEVITLLNRISSPQMKIYRLGLKVNDQEGAFYTQKEYIARKELGLPLWKDSPPPADAADASA